MYINNFFQSKTFKGVILGIAVFAVLVLVFSLGIFVGTKRADFSFRWAEAYHRNFGGPPGGFLGDIAGKEFTNANGVFGQIIKINGQTITINGKDNVEKNVVVDDKTIIRFQKQNKKLSDLKVGDNIVVMGEPSSDGQIEAELVRVMPPMPGNPPPVNTPQSPAGPNLN